MRIDGWLVVGMLAFVCGHAPVAGLTTEAQAAPKGNESRVVTVLYFDNHTRDPNLDVLGKGIADMMVTDLTGVPGLQVVERQRLQTLLDELELQSSSFFDPSTAVKVGRGLGATHAITGAITEYSPRMRIDMRLIEISTAEVAMSGKIVGDKDAFFELQQELSDKFVRALGANAAGAGNNRVDDADTLLQYAKGLEAAERGELKTASDLLAGVVREAPGMTMAQDRYKEVLRKLMQARERRGDLKTGLYDDLVAHADAALRRDPVPLGEAERKVWFAYRELRTKLALWRATSRLGRISGPLAMKPTLAESDQAIFLADVRTYVDGVLAYNDAYRRSSIKTAGGEPLLDGWEQDWDDFSHFDLAEVDREPAEKVLGLGWENNGHQGEHPMGTTRLLAGAMCTSQHRFMWQFTQGKAGWPTVLGLDASLGKSVLAEIDRTLTNVKVLMREKGWNARSAMELHGHYGDCLLAMGRDAEALARWQGALDEFPTADNYDQIEAKIKALL